MVTKGGFLSLFWGFARSLRFPQLFALAAGLFLVDLLIPDLVPFVDEILLGLLTLLFGSWRKQQRLTDKDDPTTEPPEGKVIDI